MHDGERIRVFFSNNYGMAEARASWERGAYPGHHLWGTTSLADVADVVDLPCAARSNSRFSRWIEPRFGDLRQQWRMLVDRSGPTVWYSGNFRTVGALSLLRRAHLTRTPIIVVAHDKPAGRIDAACLRGADMILCVSKRVARELIDEFDIDPIRVRTFAWGPDLAFPGYKPAGSDYILSAGKTERDLPTLLAALERTGLPGRSFAGAEIADEWARRVPNVEFRELPSAVDAVLDEHVLRDLQNAALFAVPLGARRRLFGLTELDDALALGKPIVMTRNSYIDVDIEAVGCGIWVDEGDVDGWVRALEQLMASPDLREEMGRRGREFAEREWNMSGVENALRAALVTTTRGVDEGG